MQQRSNRIEIQNNNLVRGTNVIFNQRSQQPAAEVQTTDSDFSLLTSKANLFKTISYSK